MPINFKMLFQKNWFIVFVLISLLFFQLIYSFLFPARGFSDNWLPVTTYLPKFEAKDTDTFLLKKIYPLISSEYRLNSDVGNYLELARNFTPQYFEGHVFLNRPLYPFLIFLGSLPLRFFIAPSYSIIFGLAILVNFVLLAVAVLLLFWICEKLFSLRTAFLSSILLIFSPYVHVSLIQPLAEMLIVFVVVISAYFLYNYIKKPSIFKLIAFSLVIGIFMLGKMFFAISFFILILAIYFKRYKEGIAFLIIHLIPLGFWYFWVTQVWKISYFIAEVQNWNIGTWLFNIFSWPWFETLKVLFSTLPNFIEALIRGFILIPVIFSIIGLRQWLFKSKNIFYFGSLFSIFTLTFIMNLYIPHHLFLLFPIIYPTCILGIDRVADYLKKYKSWYPPLFYVVSIGLIIIISNINIYHLFDYL